MQTIIISQILGRNNQGIILTNSGRILKQRGEFVSRQLLCSVRIALSAAVIFVLCVFRFALRGSLVRQILALRGNMIRQKPGVVPDAPDEGGPPSSLPR